MNLVQKHRIYPNHKQRQFLANQFGCCRFVWNYFVGLKQRSGYYLSYGEMSKLLTTEIKPNHSFLYNVSAQCLQQTLKDLDKTIKISRVGRSLTGFPKFKKKHWRQSCRFGQYTKVDRDLGLLFLPRIMDNPIRVVLERELPSYTMVTIVKESDDRYYACFITEIEDATIPHNPSLSHLGLDLGIKSLAVLSTGREIKNPRYFTRAEINITRKNRTLPKKKKGSRRWLKCRRVLSRAQARVRRQRLDFTHKVTTVIASDPTIEGVAIESLRIKDMQKNKLLSKSISDASWHLLIRTLRYKLEMRGKILTNCGGLFPSTQQCSSCHSITGPKTLKTRVWTCSFCGNEHDRDLNAAINIAQEGNRLYHLKPTSSRIS